LTLRQKYDIIIIELKKEVDKMRKNVTETRMFCPKCGNIQIIFRKTSKQRKFGHYKNLYCYKCKETHNHIELKDQDVSKEEIERMIEQMKKENKI
jgi:competence CoiA-like predicted nuclease